MSSRCKAGEGLVRLEKSRAEQSSMSNHDYCIVCAEHLDFTAYGPCGHKDTCSKCVIRLRTVMKDDRCVYCQQPCPRVFVTRYAGDYTKSLSKDDFEHLDHHIDVCDSIKDAQAYFDDGSHCEELKSLCSFSHPLIADGKTFSSLKALKQELKATKNAQFCSICLEGRRVFVSEQILYTKSQLQKHMKHGDDEGPMSRSAGFKGHPECAYCSKRFYGENEQYEHMTRVHEECFLCKRANPHAHVYYQNYSALEVHFQHDHHMCRHQTCLEQKFVVFSTEQELKTHTAREHGGDMTKAEKKQALSLPVGFTYNRSNDARAGGPSSERHVVHGGQQMITIGGDANMPSRSRNASRSNLEIEDRMAQMRVHEQHSRSLSTSDQARFSDTDFPTMTAPSSSGMPAVGGRWAGSSAPHHQQGRIANVTEEFPALPGTSKSAKRRAAKKKSMVSVVGAQGQPRVIHSNEDSFPSLKSKTHAALSISDDVRQANKALADVMKSIIGNEQKYLDFKESSAGWVAGNMKTSQYHKLALSLGLEDLIPDIAATCANTEKRQELLHVHSVSLSSAGASRSMHGGNSSSGQSSGPGAFGGRTTKYSQQHTRPKVSMEEDFPSLSGQITTTAVHQTPGSLKKKGKQSLSDFYKNTQVHPQNVWKNPNLKGTWASKGAGQLAQRERALNDAYAKKS